jgi:hypothetical protein
MEVSHLAVAMPGSADVCSAFRIKNNLMSALYSWQLVWEPGAAGGLAAAGADGAVVIASDTGASAGTAMNMQHSTLIILKRNHSKYSQQLVSSSSQKQGHCAGCDEAGEAWAAASLLSQQVADKSARLRGCVMLSAVLQMVMRLWCV